MVIEHRSTFYMSNGNSKPLMSKLNIKTEYQNSLNGRQFHLLN